MATVSSVGRAFVHEAKRTDMYIYGTVSSVSGDVATVTVAGADVECAMMSRCRAGDRAIVVVMKNGTSAVVGVLGGERPGGWTSYPVYSGFTCRVNLSLGVGVIDMASVSQSNTTLYYYGGGSYSTSASGVTSAIPSAYRPTSSVTAAISQDAGNNTGQMWIGSDGIVRMRPGAAVSGAKWSGQLVWTF